MEFSEEKIHEQVREGTLYKQANIKDYIECYACAHRCKIKDGGRGICSVRYNRKGKLMVPYGYVAALHNDPIEKKPFYHAYPNSSALSFGMLGCNLKCDYCQNWQISQAIRDPDAGVSPRMVSSEEVVSYAQSVNARSVVSTYNEPLITSEWAHEIFSKAKAKGMQTGFVSSGNSTPEVLDYLRPVTDMYKIDLKSFNDHSYRKLGASLDKILKSIEEVYKRGFWLEIVTLLVPDFNNSDQEIRDMAEFLFDLSPEIPWHLSGYHQDYKMKNENTTINHLSRAAEIAKDVGMYYVYVGNVHNNTNKFRDTLCPECDRVLVGRNGWQITSYDLTADGECPQCKIVIPGFWEPPKQKRRWFEL